jgi:hypothetical protein
MRTAFNVAPDLVLLADRHAAVGTGVVFNRARSRRGVSVLTMTMPDLRQAAHGFQIFRTLAWTRLKGRLRGGLFFEREAPALRETGA